MDVGPARYANHPHEFLDPIGCSRQLDAHVISPSSVSPPLSSSSSIFSSSLTLFYSSQLHTLSVCSTSLQDPPDAASSGPASSGCCLTKLTGKRRGKSQIERSVVDDLLMAELRSPTMVVLLAHFSALIPWKCGVVRLGHGLE
jgi:hypothetical protein